jgi:cbb3-type cytochrome oxidase subunit 1
MPDSQPAKKSGGFLSFLYKPEEDINYTFIVFAYAVCALICGVLFGVERFLQVDAVKGYWIVFAPFVVMLPWALVMRSRAESSFGSGATNSKEKKE